MTGRTDAKDPLGASLQRTKLLKCTLFFSKKLMGQDKGLGLKIGTFTLNLIQFQQNFHNFLRKYLYKTAHQCKSL
jgi:hypothetical protein